MTSNLETRNEKWARHEREVLEARDRQHFAGIKANQRHEGLVAGEFLKTFPIRKPGRFNDNFTLEEAIEELQESTRE